MAIGLFASGKQESTVHGSVNATDANGSGFSIIDALGRTVTFQKAPERIALAGRGITLVIDTVYLFPEASRKLVAVGKGGQGAGYFVKEIDPELSTKTMLETDTGPEQVAATMPDAVILKSYMAEKLGKPLEALGLPVVYVDMETPEQFERDLTVIGTLFRNEKRTAEILSYYRERLKMVAGRIGNIPEADKPKTLLLYYSQKDGVVAFNVAPLAWMQTIQVELSGGIPAWKDIRLGNGWTKVGLEQIAAWNADCICIIAYFDDPAEVVTKLKSDTKWQAMHAVKEGRLYAFPADYVSWDQPDPRWILGITWLASVLHPEKMKDIRMAEEIRSFFASMYGLEGSVFDATVKPWLKGAGF